MQKKIIVLAIAAALTAPALALAETSVYGLADLSISMVNDGATANSTSSNQLTSNSSRVGVKGSEDLGGGLSAIWQMEGTVGLDAGTTTTPATQSTSLFNRNTFLGLKGDSMGTVVLGLYDSPYKRATRKLDVFIDSVVADNRGLNGIGMMGSLGGTGVSDRRVSNAIDYTSPNFSGFTVAAASEFGAETSPQPAAPANKKGSSLSLAGMYSMDQIYATLAYQTVKFGNAGTGNLAAGVLIAGTAVDDEFKTFKLGGSYAMDQFAVNLVFEQPSFKDKATSTETKGTNLYLAGKFNVSGTDAVKLAYTKRGETKSAGVANKDDASQVAIGYDHGMSKTTTVYALYTKVSQNATGAADPTALSIGMKHTF